MSENDVQAKVRLKASQIGWRLWRNNTGVLKDERGVPVRFGLANDSKVVNDFIKSGDLIGVRPVLITPEMVGRTIGQFVSVEVKFEGWKGVRPGNKREQAQKRWLELVTAMGGHAIFITNEEDLK